MKSYYIGRFCILFKKADNGEWRQTTAAGFHINKFAIYRHFNNMGNTATGIIIGPYQIMFGFL